MMRRAPIPHEDVRQSAGLAVVVPAAAAGALRSRLLCGAWPSLGILLLALAHGPGPEPAASSRPGPQVVLPQEARRHVRAAAEDRPRPAALHAGRPADLRHQEQPGDRPGQRRDLLQQLHPDRRPGDLRPEPQQADRARATPSSRTPTAASRGPTGSRRSTISATPSSSRSASSRATTRASPPSAADPARRQRHRVRARQVHALQERCPACRRCGASSAARIIHDQQAATITYQDAQFELFGVPVALHALLPAPRPVGEAALGLPDADLRQFLDARAFGSRCPTTSRWRRTTTSPSIRATFADHGMLWQGDWRHRLANGQYNVKIAGIDQDGLGA